MNEGNFWFSKMNRIYTILIDENDNGMMKMIDIQILNKQQLYLQPGWTEKLETKNFNNFIILA